jgi:hypothetical protein
MRSDFNGSFGTYLDEFQCSKEAGILRTVMEAEGIRQAELGNRQHYLRWSTPETASNLEKAGISYDTTLGFADQPGYRCGTCFEYPMYDLIEGRPLRLWQYPLILMECSVLEERYLGMGYTDSAADLMGELKEQARKFEVILLCSGMAAGWAQRSAKHLQGIGGLINRSLRKGHVRR